MSLTYTSLLGLALPANGTQNGVWGTNVNDGVTSLLDSAVAGTTTLSTDADVTLTTATGAANEARSAIILWTATGSVTRNVTAPASSKVYTVLNATGGTQSIVLRGTGPTTGVTIIAGEKAVVSWNGSDYTKVSSSVPAAGGANAQVQYNASGILGGSSDLTFSAATLTATNITVTTLASVPTQAVTDSSTKAASTAFVRSIIPSGLILLWSGSAASIPAGWLLCDGTLGTPNLRDRFIVGAGTTYAVGATGGSTDAIVVSHTHTATTGAAGSHSHTLSSVAAFNSNDNASSPVDYITGTNTSTVPSPQSASASLQSTALLTTAPDHTHSVSVASAGGSGVNANLPPYYALCYIMKS